MKARRVDLHTDLNWSQSAVYKFQYLELGNFNFAKRNAEFSLWDCLIWKRSNPKMSCQWDNSTPLERNLGQCDSVVVVFFCVIILSEHLGQLIER